MKKKIMTVFLACAMGFTAAACSTRNPGSSDDPFANEQIDQSRTQLYVYNFNGGYGADWLNSVKIRYEELHKDDVYEKDKKGIQIYVTNKKESIETLTNSILDNREEVYFTEYAYYYTLKAAGVLGDITEAVTADLSAYGDEAGSTIESKPPRSRRIITD